MEYSKVVEQLNAAVAEIRQLKSENEKLMKKFEELEKKKQKRALRNPDSPFNRLIELTLDFNKDEMDSFFSGCHNDETRIKSSLSSLNQSINYRLGFLTTVQRQSAKNKGTIRGKTIMELEENERKLSLIVMQEVIEAIRKGISKSKSINKENEDGQMHI